MVKNPPANAGDAGLIAGSGRSPGGGSDNPLQYSCLGHPRTEEPGRRQSVGLQRVGHDWALPVSNNFFNVCRLRRKSLDFSSP